MQEHPHIEPLLPVQIDQAFPLVQTRYPGLILPQWRRFARALLGTPRGVGIQPVAPSGIVTARNAQGYLSGLFSYRGAADLRHEKVLEVATFIAAGLFDPLHTIETLVNEIERLATALGCAAMRVEHPQPVAVAELLLKRLYGDCQIVETVSLCKELRQAA
jgi:hypothetical protein